MNILLAIDESESAQRLVAALLAFVRELREPPRIHVLYVHPPIPIGYAKQHAGREAVDDYYREEGDAILRPAANQLQAAGLSAESHVRVGEAGDTIAEAAKDLGCALIWMGSHGRGAVTQALLGSVASRVIELADRPVTVVR